MGIGSFSGALHEGRLVKVASLLEREDDLLRRFPFLLMPIVVDSYCDKAFYRNSFVEALNCLP